jgi:selenocysteine lyase/cysteine desulfurase
VNGNNSPLVHYRVKHDGLDSFPPRDRGHLLAVSWLWQLTVVLAVAGVRAAVRAGRVRASFHLYTTDKDVDLALDTLAS